MIYNIAGRNHENIAGSNTCEANDLYNQIV